MDSLFFALGSVLPVFLMVGSGYLMRRRGSISREFCDSAARFNFRFCFPAMVFDSLYSADFGKLFSAKLLLLSLASILVILAMGWVAGALFFRGAEPRIRGLRGSFIQGSFRGNIVLLGLPMAIQVFGESARAQTAIITAIIVTAYNVLSVIVLALNAQGNNRPSVASMVKTIFTNPMIIGVMTALPFALSGTGIPKPVSVFIKYFGVMTVPLALIDIGAGMVGRTRPSNFGRVLAAAAIKTALSPLVYGAIFMAGGMGSASVAIMVMLAATPTATASFPMAKVMGCDAELAGDIVLVSTLMSAFTIAAVIVVLRSAGMA